jgi:hypothetical protein
MHKHLLTTFAVAFCSSGIASFPLTANAQTLLTRATVRDLRNQVELFLKQQPKSRPAKKADNMTPGDSLQTYRKAMAELRFNDNSLARIGEQAIFRFIPNTRNLSLQKGTVLLLIPPGRGRTQVNTPNAVAGIRGSALFVRYIEDTGVTIVGALTDSAIEISNADGSQTYVLKAGQLGTVHKNQIGVYDFDLKAFHNTSPLMKDIDMQGLEAVGQEMAAPRTTQVFANSKPESVLNTPAWTLSAENRPGSPPAIATSGSSQVLFVPGYDPNKTPYEWSAILSTLKQYSDPTQTFPMPTATAPQPLVIPSIPGQSISSGVSTQPNPPAIAPSRPSPAPVTPPTQIVNPPVSPPTASPAPVAPPTQIANPPVSPPTASPAPVAPPTQIANPPISPPAILPDPVTPPTQIANPPISPPAILPAPITPPVAIGTPPTPPMLAPAPPAPPVPITPPVSIIAPPVVTPLPTPVISAPTVTVPAIPATPAIPAIPGGPGGPATPAVPAVPATPAVPGANVVTAPQVTPNLDLPSVQPGLGATIDPPPDRPAP